MNNEKLNTIKNMTEQELNILGTIILLNDTIQNIESDKKELQGLYLEFGADNQKLKETEQKFNEAIEIAQEQIELNKKKIKTIINKVLILLN